MLRRRPIPAVAESLAPRHTRSRIGPLQITIAVLILVVALLPMPLPLLALGPIVIAILTPAAGWLSIAFFCIVAGFSGELDYRPLDLGLVNLYAIDSIAALFAWTAFHAFLQYHRERRLPAFQNRGEQWLIGLWATWCCLGVVFLAYGYLVQGYAFDRAFGDFRRQVWYAAAFFVPLLFPLSKRHLAALKYVIVTAGIITISIGVHRIVTDSPARVDENFATGHLGARWVWIVECMTLSTMLAYLVLVLRSGSGLLWKVFAIALCFPAAGLLLLSGWRLAMAYTVIAPAAAFLLFAWTRREPIHRFIFGAIVVGIAAIPPLLMVPMLLPDLFNDMMLDLRMRLLNDPVRGGFRSWANQAAAEQFESSPIIGKGFGYYLVVAVRNQSGFFNYSEMSNAHNLPLTVLYQTGILGFVPFMLFHGLFAYLGIRSLRALPASVVPTYIALFVGYVCYVGYALTQPFVSSQFIILYMTMGFVVRLARPSGEQASAPPAT